MAAARRRLLVPLLFLAGAVALTWAVTRYGPDLAAGPTGAALPPEVSQPLLPGQKVTFLELGSVGCKPCEAMKPVMQAVRERFPEQVEVIFHDVKKDPSAAGRYRVRLIPTQVFLLPDSREFFRHEGYFPEGEVLAVLRRMGVH
ncbi:MAG: thioredoxin family protein [Proteobacteria bacterium]|nr:thioredoxin family protein [Pseudomonadota bacterium]